MTAVRQSQSALCQRWGKVRKTIGTCLPQERSSRRINRWGGKKSFKLKLEPVTLFRRSLVSADWKRRSVDVDFPAPARRGCVIINRRCVALTQQWQRQHQCVCVCERGSMCVWGGNWSTGSVSLLSAPAHSQSNRLTCNEDQSAACLSRGVLWRLGVCFPPPSVTTACFIHGH